jgi:hypothetical protein
MPREVDEDGYGPSYNRPNIKSALEFTSGPANDAFNEARQVTEPACAGFDIEIFFTQTDIPLAKSICGNCPLQTLCREAARERMDEYGVFGGESSSERVQVVATERAIGVTGKPCRAGLHLMVPGNIHYHRVDSPTCNPCRKQKNNDRMERSRRARGVRPGKMRDKRGLFV